MVLLLFITSLTLTRDITNISCAYVISALINYTAEQNVYVLV